MALYTMPDGSEHEFSSDDVATKAYKAWKEQFGTNTTSWGEDLQGAFAKTMGTVAQGVGLGAEVLARPFGEQDKAIADTESMVEYWKQQDPTLGKEQGAGKLVNAAAALPMYMSPVGLGTMLAGSTRQSGTDIIKEGGDTDTAMQSAAADLGMGAAGAALPVSMVAGPVKNALAGASSNVGQEVANRFAQNRIRQEAGLQQLPDMDKWDVASAAIPGAGMGFAFAKKGKEVSSPKVEEQIPEVSGASIKQRAVQQREQTISKLESEIDSYYKMSMESNLDPEASNRLRDMENSLAHLKGEVDAIRGVEKPVEQVAPPMDTEQPWGKQVDTTEASNPFFKAGDPTKINTEVDSVGNKPFFGEEVVDSLNRNNSAGFPVAGELNKLTGEAKVAIDGVLDRWSRGLPEHVQSFIKTAEDLRLFVSAHEKAHQTWKQGRIEKDLDYEKRINAEAKKIYEEHKQGGKSQTAADLEARDATEALARERDLGPIEDEQFSERQMQLDLEDASTDRSLSRSDWAEQRRNNSNLDVGKDAGVEAPKNTSLIGNGKFRRGVGGKQGGAIDPSVISDTIKSALKTFSSDNLPIKKYTDLDSAVIDMKKIPDISSFGAGSVQFFGKRQFGKIYEENPLINYAINSVNKADSRATEISNNLWYGFAHSLPKGGVGPFTSLKRVETDNSPSKVLRDSSNESVVKVMKAFEDGFDKGQDYATTLKEYSSKFTTQETKLWQTLEHYFVQLSSGIKETRKGWFPAVRRGNFMVKLQTNGTSVHAETFRSTLEAENFIRKWNEQKNKDGVEASTVYDLGEIYKNQQMDFELATRITDIIANEIVPNKQAEIKKLVDTMLGNPDPFKPHQRHRSGIKGYEGSQLFKKESDLAQSWRETLHSVADEHGQRVKRGMINKDLVPLIDSPTGLERTHENTMSAVSMIRDNEMNKLSSFTEGFDNAVRESADNLALKIARSFGNDTWFPKVNTFDKTHATATRLFYIQALTTRPVFWFQQAIASPLAVREMLREDSLMKAMAASGKGSLNVVYGGNADFVKAVTWVKQNTNSFHPNFLNELNQLGKKDGQTLASHVFETLSGEKMSTAADSFSRYWTFSMFYESLKAKGLRGKELYKAAADKTNDTMIMYSKNEKPPVIGRMGITGQAISPLMTFATGALGNFVADIRLAKRTGNIKPALFTILLTGALGGTQGIPFVGEWELLRKTLQWFDDDIEIPSIVDSSYKHLPDWMSLGVPSAMAGMDVGSGLRWNPIISGAITGESDFLSLLPTFKFAADTTSNAGTSVKYAAGGNVRESDYRNAQMRSTPGGYKGLMDDLQFDAASRPMVPDAKGKGLVEQTDKERAATYLGTRTIERVKAENINRQLQQKELKRSAYIDKRIDILVDALMKNDDKKIASSIDDLIGKEVSSKQISSMAENEIKARNIPILERFVSGTSGQISSDDQKRKYIELLKYHINMDGKNE